MTDFVTETTETITYKCEKCKKLKKKNRKLKAELIEVMAENEENDILCNAERKELIEALARIAELEKQVEPIYKLAVKPPVRCCDNCRLYTVESSACNECSVFTHYCNWRPK